MNASAVVIPLVKEVDIRIFPFMAQAIELNNGRAAQMGILGLMMHECVDNHPYIINDLVRETIMSLENAQAAVAFRSRLSR